MTRLPFVTRWASTSHHHKALTITILSPAQTAPAEQIEAKAIADNFFTLSAVSTFASASIGFSSTAGSFEATVFWRENLS